MARVALVTGGTRGIGAAIAIALKEAVTKLLPIMAAIMRLQKPSKTKQTFPVYKWDVGDFAASEAGLKQVESDLGAIDILVANAGITRDGFLHKMTQENWSDVIRTNLDSLYNLTRPAI